MDQQFLTNSDFSPPQTAVVPPGNRGNMQTLLGEIAAPSTAEEEAIQNRLLQRRLGMASSLFFSLRARDQATASHSLRVAICCSSWAEQIQCTSEFQDSLEIAALLHDIGKLGVPDRVLRKSTKLDTDDRLHIEKAAQRTVEIVAPVCRSPAVIKNLFYNSAWYDGSREGFDRKGDALPVGARMMSIVDAFDAMTTEQVYRRAVSNERAMSELFEFAGSQFDPVMVQDFCRLLSGGKIGFDAAVAQRWLKTITSSSSNAHWGGIGSGAPPPSSSGGPQRSLEDDLTSSMVDHMLDGVVLLDQDMTVRRWNPAAEKLTGIAAASVIDRQFLPSLVQMLDEQENVILDDKCPVVNAILDAQPTGIRFQVVDLKGGIKLVHALIVPKVDDHGQPCGAAMLLHDASSRANLEEKVQKLHERATQDGLTKLTNRAEFERIHAELVSTFAQGGDPSTLIICDIDFFKKINDVHGHQAGDEVLVRFARILKSMCRLGDTVARFGGEEFVMICLDTGIRNGVERAEEVRRRIADTPMLMLNNQCITISLGVTEIQPGDTTETMLRRADRGLLQAKDEGRNRVIQIGAGLSLEATAPELKRTWFSWLSTAGSDVVVEKRLLASVPMNVCAEKLKGFMADHGADMVEVIGDHVVMKIDGQNSPALRRGSDRAPFYIEITFQEARLCPDGQQRSVVRTIMHVKVRPKRKRDRRRRDLKERANQLIASVRSYFVAQETDIEMQTGPDERLDHTSNSVFKAMKQDR
jgi:diguanylate cyclase (GGDEF)-like protein/PAS domain S-box-containing protein